MAAEQIIRSGLENLPDSVLLRAELGDILLVAGDSGVSGKYEEARAVFDELKAHDPASPRPYLGLTRLAHRQRDYDAFCTNASAFMDRASLTEHWEEIVDVFAFLVEASFGTPEFVRSRNLAVEVSDRLLAIERRSNWLAVSALLIEDSQPDRAVELLREAQASWAPKDLGLREQSFDEFVTTARDNLKGGARWWASS